MVVFNGRLDSLACTAVFFEYLIVLIANTQVMDSMGKVAGLVDIAKCLYDAVHRMEKQVRKKQEEEGSDEDDDSTLVLGAMMEAAKAVNKDKASAKNQKALQVIITWFMR